MEKTTYGFDKGRNFPLMGIHTFATSQDGQLRHFIDDKLRATVPPEGWSDYCKEYPDAKDIVDSLTLRPSVEATAAIPAPSPDFGEGNGGA
jgi:hypothetical protein